MAVAEYAISSATITWPSDEGAEPARTDFRIQLASGDSIVREFATIESGGVLNAYNVNAGGAPADELYLAPGQWLVAKEQPRGDS